MEKDLVEIFRDTREMCVKNPKLVNAVKHMIINQKLYSSAVEVYADKDVYEEPVDIIVSRNRSLEAAFDYISSEYRVGVLNFANSFTPGGGVLTGAKSQEESICRSTTLYSSITDYFVSLQFYEAHEKEKQLLGTDDIIYSPDVVVFKTDSDYPELLPEEEWFNIDVFTCAAPDIASLKKQGEEISHDELFKIFEKRFKRIFDVMIENETDVAILGAFGCGEFGNPPELVAKAAKKVIEEYKNAFAVIEFAVYCPDSQQKNYKVFKKVFEEQNLKNFLHILKNFYLT